MEHQALIVRLLVAYIDGDRLATVSAWGLDAAISVQGSAHTERFHAQFPHHQRFRASTRYAVGTAENGFTIRSSVRPDCRTNE